MSRHHARRLRHPPTLLYIHLLPKSHLPSLLYFLSRSSTQRRTPTTQHLDTTQIKFIDQRRLRHCKRHWRHQREIRDPVSLNMRQHFREVEPGHDVHGDLAYPCIYNHDCLRRGVVHRKEAQKLGAGIDGCEVRVQLSLVHDLHDAGDVIVVGNFDALGRTGRAGGVVQGKGGVSTLR